MDNNNNSPPHNPDEEDDNFIDEEEDDNIINEEVEENVNDNQENINIPNARHIQELYRPPISFICPTDIRTVNSPPPRSIVVLLNMPPVPFIVNRRPLPSMPTMAVTCGVLPLTAFDNYVQFMSGLTELFGILVEHVEATASLNDPVPGYEVSYELMGPVRRRVPFFTHSWREFKARVRLIVIEKP